VLSDLLPSDAAWLLKDLGSDDIAHILSVIPNDRAKEILALMRTEDSTEIADLLKYPRRRVNHAIKGNCKSANTFELIGCSAQDFKLHLEKQFQPGMSWDNYGTKGWHIDHIIPCYKFDLSNPQEQRKCFHFSNQRPLWSKDNLSRKRY
jgi:hypothetical protein